MASLILVGVPKADRHSHEPTPTMVNIVTDKAKEPEVKKPRPVQQDYSREVLKSYLRTVFTQYGIEDQIPTAEAIIACESGWNVLADNGISKGIFQYTGPTWHDFGTSDIFNPYKQIEVTAKIVKREGWNRWDCFTGKR